MWTRFYWLLLIVVPLAACNGANSPASSVASQSSEGSGVSASATSVSSAKSEQSQSSSAPMPVACEMGHATTDWAESCPQTSTYQCLAGTWQALPTGSDGQPLRYESEHFAFYWNAGTNIDIAGAQGAAQTLEMIWDRYFNSSINFKPPFCDSATKYKATVHFDNDFPLWGGSWRFNGQDIPGMWVGPSAANDRWSLAHEFAHGAQAMTAAFPDCGGTGCWVWESHANWLPHQIYRDNAHCSELLVNSSHLHYGNTRTRYCNWQFFEYVKNKHCADAVNTMWSAPAVPGQGDPFQKLMVNQGWNISELNDLFGEWAIHNVTWDYQNPDGSDQGAVYRAAYGPITDTQSSYSQRRLRLTQLEPLDTGWAQHRRFQSPYYWAPQRWGYNVVQLFPERDASQVRVRFRGVIQAAANSGWRWGLVATDANLSNPRYSPIQKGSDGELNFCLSGSEQLFLVVLAAPTEYQRITWQQPADGTPYPSIYRYPYMVEFEGAWPQGFADGTRDNCEAGLSRHSNGGGCAPTDTPASVYVSPFAKILGGDVRGNARIEDHATVINGQISDNASVGALSIVGVNANPHHGPASFNVGDDAQLFATFYPMGWFGNQLNLTGTARFVGDLEAYTGKSQNTFYGLVDDGWQGVTQAQEVTIQPPYQWR